MCKWSLIKVNATTLVVFALMKDGWKGDKIFVAGFLESYLISSSDRNVVMIKVMRWSCKLFPSEIVMIYY